MFPRPLLILLVLLAHSIQSYEVSPNQKMIIVFGDFLVPQFSAKYDYSSWKSCWKYCFQASRCLAASWVPAEDLLSCLWFELRSDQLTKTISKLDSSSNKKVALKISLPSGDCPSIAQGPPLFGNNPSTLTLLEDDEFWETTITESSDKWTYSSVKL